MKKEKKIKKKKINVQERLTPWTKYYGNVPQHLEYPNKTMSELIEDTVNLYPNNIAIEYYKTTYTYRQLQTKIIKTACALKALGIMENEVVTICMPNTPEAIICFYAVNMVGGICNMIHPLSSENEIAFYLEKSKSSYILTIDISYDKVMKVISNTNIKKVIVASPSVSMKNVMKSLYWLTKGRTINIDKKDARVITWEAFLNDGFGYNKEIKVKRDMNDPAVIMYSGGTTGKPKGIVLSNANFNAMAYQCHLMCDPSKEGDSILSIMPIFHGLGLSVCIHTPLHIGMRCILVPDFSPKKFPELIRKYHPNFIVGVPTLFEGLLKNSFNDNELSCITCAVSGGDTLQSELKLRVDQFLNDHGSKTKVREGYGLTEASGATCLTPTNFYKKDSIGIPFPDTYYKIVQMSTHEEVPNNTDGEICISGPTIMLGYLDDVNETMQTLQIHEDGRVWLHTGDIGSMDEDGFVYFKQRLKRLIISSGYNIYPSQIEKVINTHPLVLTSTVIGVPHPYKVQVAKACIVLKDGVELNDEVKESIKEHCEKNIAKYSLPYYFEYRDSLPKTLIGKVAYKQLEEESK